MWMEHLEEDVWRPMRQESRPTTRREGKDPQDDRSAIYYWVETVPVTSSHVKKLEVTEMKMCRCACGHTLRYHVRNGSIGERLKVENITEMCREAGLG